MPGQATGLFNALKAARQRAGMSQRALADRIAIPQSHISKIEAGAVDAQISTVVEIARSLGYDLRLIPRSALLTVDSIVHQHVGAVDQELTQDLARRFARKTSAVDSIEQELAEIPPAYSLDDDDA
jgi:predicted transcriptional regulator